MGEGGTERYNSQLYLFAPQNGNRALLSDEGLAAPRGEHATDHCGAHSSLPLCLHQSNRPIEREQNNRRGAPSVSPPVQLAMRLAETNCFTVRHFLFQIFTGSF